MAFAGTRIQSLIYVVGSAPQADISTISTTFQRFRKLDMSVPALAFGTEDDRTEIGKGHEFATTLYPTAWDFAGRIEKYGSAEFICWAWAYALGDIALATGLYTIHAIDPTVSLELPYFTVAAQLGEGGGEAIDEAYVGNAVESVETTFNYGPGRQNVKTTCDYVGTGQHVLPSGVTFPGVLAESYTTAATMTITINGTNYVSTQRVLRGSMGWKNNIILPLRYLPGDGLVSGSMVGKRLIIGARIPTFTFTTFLTHTSPEFAALYGQTSGTASIHLAFDATHYCQWDYPSIQYRAHAREQEEGLVAVTVDVEAKYDPTVVAGKPNGTVVFTSKNVIADL